MITPKEISVGVALVYPVRIAYSALLENGFSSSGSCPENVTVAFGFKPTASTTPPINDMSGHYLLTIRKEGGEVVVYKDFTRLATYSGTMVPVTVADLVTQVLIDLCGNTKGYYSRMVVVAGAVGPGNFWKPSPKVSGLYVPKRVVGMDILTRLDFTDGANLGGTDWSMVGDQTTDTPTNNHATLSPWMGDPDITLSGGNLTATSGSVGGYSSRPSTFFVSQGKWYWETVWNWTSDANGIGIARGNTRFDSYIGNDANGYGYYAGTGNLFHNGSLVATYASSSDGDVIGVAFDADNSTLQFFKNGTPLGDRINCIPGEYSPTVSDGSTGGRVNATMRFGATGFVHEPPQGFLPFCAESLPEPIIQQSKSCADIVLREGSGGLNSVDSLRFSPDFITIKARSVDKTWNVVDAVRGPDHWITTSNTGHEYITSSSVMSFDPRGYTLGGNHNVNSLNVSFIDLCLKAGRDQGFEIVKYTGNGVAGRQVVHGLGNPPTFMMVKNLTGGGYWRVYHVAMGAEFCGSFLKDPFSAILGTWNDTEPTGTTFTLGINNDVNASGSEYIAYLFTDSDVFKTFSYTGNGKADGPFVFLGGKPLSVPFLKNADRGGPSWRNMDSVRDRYNPIAATLCSDTSEPEYISGEGLSFTANGLKAAGDGVGLNGSGERIVGLAVLESVQKYSNSF